MAGRPLPASLLREGRAMHAAVVADLLAIPGCHVATTLDERQRVSSTLPPSQFLEVEYVDETAREQTAFDRLCIETSATLVIAPETGGELNRRVQHVVDLGRLALNCASHAIGLCGDKLRLAEHLLNQGIATIHTRAVPDSKNPWDVFAGDCVVKPRDGAGSWLTFLVPDRDAVRWECVRGEMKAAHMFESAIIQPYIAGESLSVGCLCDSVGNVEVFPIARQSLNGPNFEYQGGSLPAELEPRTVAAIHELARSACKSIHGLRGYVGIDLLLPDASSISPLIVEVNPRLTTSYIGYRKLCRNNIAERMLSASVSESLPPLDWNSGSVTFDAAGDCQHHIGGGPSS
ncbi:MAG: carbamoyl phosphate synthase-like protein [Schlesneria sp.]|nr:carbamoyl phosphate synthase-like protein [Schlesneria sp.]